MTRGFNVADPAVTLVNYNGGTANAVRVTASATKRLPFSSLLTGRGATIAVMAQASITEGGTYNACLRALDPGDTRGAITFSGSIIYRAACGVASLSTNAESILANGIDEDNFEPGILMSRGGIESWFADNGFVTRPYMNDLYDPYASLTPPNNPTPQTYSCTPGGTLVTATTVVRTQVQDIRYSGTRSNRINTVVSTTDISDNTVGPTADVTVPFNTVNGTPAPVVTRILGTVSETGSGSDRVFYRTDRVTTVTTTYSNVVSTVTTTQASLSPGTYSDLQLSCNTVFNPGIYVLNGGRLKITSGYNVTGAGVMFVLKNGAYIDIQGTSTVTLSGPTQSQLQAWGVAEADAADLEGMIVFEDRTGPGTNNKNTINGTTDTVLNGTVYLSISDITLSGTASVTSRCLTIAAWQVKVSGNAYFTNFCPIGTTYDGAVAESSGSVKLVT